MKHQLLFSSAGIATQILISSEKDTILLDIGDGIIRDLLKTEINFSKSQSWHIFISHGHYDHCGGLFSFLGFLRMLGLPSNINVYYPSESIEVESLLDVFTSIYKDSLPFKLKNRPLKNNETVRISRSIYVKSYPMVHYGSIVNQGLLARVPTYGYAIFHNKIKYLAFTGDTGINNNLVDLVKDAEYAFIEATNPEDISSKNHLNEEEALNLGKLAKRFLLIHTKYDSR
ncbi:MBL fold metallo-hydrolase [Candidatus Hodarchaeum mangrovi]